METTTPVAVPLSSVPENTRQDARFLQGRLELFARFGAVVASVFLLKDVVMLGTQGWDWGKCLGHRPFVASAVGTAVLLVFWMTLRLWRRPPAGALPMLDVVFVLATTGAYAYMAYTALPFFGIGAVTLAVLITAVTLMSRSLIVPSRAQFAAVVNLIGGLPALGLALYTDLRTDLTPGLDATANTTIWIATFVALATIAARVLHGLRERVREARQLGQYTLDEKVGEGGMGIVYRASHAMLRRPTAIKLLPPARVTATQLARFEREVQLTAALTHPNTISVFDFGRTPDGVFYYAMEYLDGMSLDRLVDDEGALPPARVIHILLQACGALAEAHDVGLIHRDIKPANIFLCERGGVADFVKVLDFGLVKDVRGGQNDKVTQTDVITGTPQYMAPEAIRDAAAVTTASDIYALGAVGYFLVTGQDVFEGKTVVEICAAHLHQAPAPPSERGVAVPADLEALLLDCLAKSPADRPRDAREVRDRLEACADAGRWTREDALAWWREHRPRVVSHEAGPLGVGKDTIDVDVHDRLAAAE